MLKAKWGEKVGKREFLSYWKSTMIYEKKTWAKRMVGVLEDVVIILNFQKELDDESVSWE